MNSHEHPHDIPKAHPIRVEVLPYAPMALPVQRLPMPMSTRHAALHLLLMICVWFVSEITIGVIAVSLPEMDAQWMQLGASLVLGLALTAACVFMLFVDGHKLLTLGWTTHNLKANLGLGVVATIFIMPVLFVLMLALVLLFPQIIEDRLKAAEMIEETFPKMSMGTLIIMSLWVAVWEETVFRGFLLTRLHAITRNWPVAILVGAAIFAVIHYPQGISAVFMIFVLGLALGGLMAWRKSLVPCIVFHALFDFIQLNLAQYVFEGWPDAG
jgi:membrane protease YdiL (CAAX protease family)